jgi:hypothetical protein
MSGLPFFLKIIRYEKCPINGRVVVSKRDHLALIAQVQWQIILQKN